MSRSPSTLRLPLLAAACQISAKYRERIPLSKAISLRPDHTLSYAIRAVAYLESGDEEHGLSDLNRYIDSTSVASEQLWAAYVMRSGIFNEQGEKAKADADAAKAEELKRQLAIP